MSNVAWWAHLLIPPNCRFVKSTTSCFEHFADEQNTASDGKLSYTNRVAHWSVQNCISQYNVVQISSYTARM